MATENPFRKGDRVTYVGGKRHYVLHLHASYKEGGPHGVVMGIWRKGWRHMVDVDFPDHGFFVCYPDELKFNVLDTLGAM